MPLTSTDPAPRRVLMTTDVVGGVWNYSLTLARALAPFGVEVHLASMGGALRQSQQAELVRAGNVTLHPAHYALEWMGDPWSDVARARDWLERLAERIQPDLVHLNQYSFGSLAETYPTVIVGHSCVYSWHYAAEGRWPAPAWREYRSRITQGLRAVHAVTAPSNTMLQSLRSIYGGFRAWRPIYNAAFGEEASSHPREKMILAVGRVWDKGKNIPLLDEIAGGLDWPICVAGETDGPYGTAELSGRVRRLGYLSRAQLRQWYDRAAVFAAPAFYEPFGLTALEAAQSGCALVLSDIGSFREIWRDAAVFVDPGDPRAWQVTLQELAARPDRRMELARKARQRAGAFTPHRMAGQYMELYRHLLSLGGAGGVTRSRNERKRMASIRTAGARDAWSQRTIS